MAPFVSGLFYPAQASALRGPGEQQAVCGVRRATGSKLAHAEKDGAQRRAVRAGSSSGGEWAPLWL